MKTAFLTIILIALAVFLLCVKIIFKKGGTFPSGHVHDIPKLRDKGIACASSQVENRQKKHTES